MVERRKIIRRKPVVEEEIEDIEDDDVDASMEDEIGDDDLDDEDDIEDDDEEDEPKSAKKVSKPVVKVATKPAKAVRTAVKAPVDDDEPDEDEPKPAKAAKPAVKIGKPTPKVAVSVAKVSKNGVDDEDEAPAPKKSLKVKTVAQSMLPDLMEGLAEGKALLISRTGENTWTATLVEAAPVATGKRKKVFGKEYWDTVLSPEFVQFDAEWKELTPDEKVKAAKKSGVVLERGDKENEGIFIMKLTSLVREARGISKYKPEYQDRAARAVVRGG